MPSELNKVVGVASKSMYEIHVNANVRDTITYSYCESSKRACQHGYPGVSNYFHAMVRYLRYCDS